MLAISMSSPDPLGEFEQLVLLSVMRLRDRAYGVKILKEIEDRTSRSVSRGAVYMTLERLEAKGHLRSWMADPTPERGGRSRRYYALTRTAVAALSESRRSLLNMWKGLEPFLGQS